MTGDIAPSATSVKRLFVADVLAHDRFAILVDGDVVVEVDYPTARRYWLGRVRLDDLVKGGALALKK